MSDYSARPKLSRQAFVMANVQFLDRNGNPYDPATVEKRVVVASPFHVITDWTAIPGFSSGDDVQVTANEMEIYVATALVETHIVLLVGDRNTATENPLRIIVQVKNREVIP